MAKFCLASNFEELYTFVVYISLVILLNSESNILTPHQCFYSLFHRWMSCKKATNFFSNF